MLAGVSVRAKILIGIAAACGVYVVMMPSAEQTVEAVGGAHSEQAGRVRASRPAPAGAGSSLIKAVFRGADRVVSDAKAAALFSAHSWYVAPPAPPPPPPSAPVHVTPTAPPLPFAFMGSYRPEGREPIYFLTVGDRVYDVKVGDTVDTNYTVDQVKAGQMTLTYKPLNQQQSLAVDDPS